MTNNDIEGILKMRMAVYQEGIKAGFWTDLNQSGASELMDYLFPKSGQLAYYNLLMEMIKSEHVMLTGGVYFLFKMPVQMEKEIANYLKSHEKGKRNYFQMGTYNLALRTCMKTRIIFTKRDVLE